MSASEFAFLALGLVLGLATGAALIEVLRSRPPSTREVRVTVAPNAIHARYAATLSHPTATDDDPGPAELGPGDRRQADGLAQEPDAPPARRAGDVASAAVPGSSAQPARPAADPVRDGTPVPSASTDGGREGRLDPLRPAPIDDLHATTKVAVPMSLEPDPLTAALRSTAAAVATVAMADPEGRSSVGHPMAVAVAATTGTKVARGQAASAQASSTDGAGASGDGPALATGPSGSSAPASAPAPVEAGPCADERRIADERCAVATRAREGAETAADALRTAQRAYDEHLAAAEAGTAAADPRSVRGAKEAAQQRFRDARARATTRDDVEGAARVWLAEINQINTETRDAAARAERSRAAATSLAMTLERLAVEADAARISAEQADEACVAAREALAACDEARALEAAVAARAAEAPAGSDAPADGPADTPPPPVAAGAGGTIAAATPEPAEEFAIAGSMGSRAGQDALILRILRGDHAAMQHAVARLAGSDPEETRRRQAQLGGLADALIARSIEASAFDFPIDHFFWGPFSQSQNRDIAAGLSSLGFRFDGFGGWVDERFPSQRDLALAVGYAGLDPMRIRRWPNEAETRDLLQDVRVAADEYVASAAGGMTLGELVTLLGRRADALTDLWNDWGTVRPVLLGSD
ncbi:MAG TPA: hypothetical protein VH440_07335 [Candidatus Limnocylindrales bacterium]